MRATTARGFRPAAARTLRWEQRSEAGGRRSRLAAGLRAASTAGEHRPREGHGPPGAEQGPEDETPGASPGRDRPGRGRREQAVEGVRNAEDGRWRVWQARVARATVASRGATGTGPVTPRAL